MKYFYILLKFVTLILLIWSCGFIWFISKIPAKVDKDILATDAIVVLTGGSGRVDEGIALLAKGKAKKLFISGVGKDTNINDISKASKNYSADLENIENNIALGYEADNTVGNAIETKNWMISNNFQSITLVTSNYHIPRSLAEFKSIMKGYTIIPHPVFSSSVRVEKWWAFPGTMKLILSEYNKYLLHKIK